MNCITRHRIHKEIQWFQRTNSTYSPIYYNTITDGIDHWKNILVDAFNFKQGFKVGIASSVCDLRYLSLVFAVLELGGELLILDKPTRKENVHGIRSRVLAPFDLYVYDPKVDENAREVGNVFSKTQASLNLWREYVCKTFEYSKIFDCSDNSTMMLATSSGSTSTPKPIHYSHNFINFVSNRCTRLFEFKENDRILHTANLHHGGSAGVYFFPTIEHCKFHYFEYVLNPNELDNIVSCVVNNQINKIMFPNNMIVSQFIKMLPPIDHKLDIYCLQANSLTWLDDIRRANINSITSIFGASEVLGPIFINQLTPNTPDSHNVLNYGKLLDDDYQVEIKNENCLQVTVPYRGTHLLNDQFELDFEDNYIFCKRSDLIRINEVTLEFDFLDRLCLEYFKDYEAFLIADTTTNKIYLACDYQIKESINLHTAQIQEKLQEISPFLQIDYVDFVNIQNYFDSIKINREQLKTHFRKKFNLT